MSQLKLKFEILKFIKAVICYLNVLIVYRILLTMSVITVEKSFSKLKLFKYYLRSKMSQERFNGLAILRIEKDVIEYIVVDTIISDFAYINARKNCFVWTFEY